jgi:hypothetical protein
MHLQLGSKVRVLVFNMGLLVRSQSCDRLSPRGFTAVFLGPKANPELVPKFHVALYASNASL